jgi:transcriptional regulator with XRE-family HTH domain
MNFPTLPPMLRSAAEARQKLLLQLANEAKKKKRAWSNTPAGKEAAKMREIRHLYKLPGLVDKDLPNDGSEPIPQTFSRQPMTRERRLLQLQGQLPEQLEMKSRAERIAHVYSRPLLTIHQVMGPWSTAQIAEGTGIQKVMVSKTLRGMIKLTVDRLLRLSLFLDLDVFALAAFLNYQRIAFLKWGARRMARPPVNRRIK